MARRLVSLTLDNLADLPAPCHDCAFWELDPALGRPPDPAFEKESWISDVLLQWGSCGLLIEVDGTTAGYALFAPPAYVPRSGAFATSPPAADAVLLAALRVDATYRGAGLGRVLVQGVAREVATRGLRAIEAFGHTGLALPGGRCLIPAEFLQAVGFKTVRPHPLTPRLRLDLRSTITWRADVEQAIDRLRGSVRVPRPSLSGA